MEALQQHKPYFRLRKVDIVDWNSDVARQHRVQSIPDLRLYRGSELISSDEHEIVDMLNGL